LLNFNDSFGGPNSTDSPFVAGRNRRKTRQWSNRLRRTVAHPKVVGEARLRPLARCSTLPAGRGIEIVVIGNDTSAHLDLAAIGAAIGPRNKLVLSHVPTQGGLVN